MAKNGEGKKSVSLPVVKIRGCSDLNAEVEFKTLASMQFSVLSDW